MAMEASMGARVGFRGSVVTRREWAEELTVTEMVASAELGVPHEEEWRGGFLGILGS
jgi:hypothetical protein